MIRLTLPAACSLFITGVLVCIPQCKSQVADEPLRILKVDPPNWYAAFPKPLLLVQGQALNGATFSLSDSSLRIERTLISANGHWAQLFISASPARPETVQLRIASGTAHVEMPYTFAARRLPSDGMGGFSSRDVIYLIMPDRFADGDPDNDGPGAHSPQGSPEAVAERAKPMGWHGGDIPGIGQHLDYLQTLGVTAVWSTPVYQNHEAEGYHGYHATDYYSVDQHYGTLAQVQQLARDLHLHHMKLILDIVPNHVGPFHPWVTDEPAADWFHGTLAQHVRAEYNFNALVDEHAPERDRLATLHGWFVDLLPDMNTDSPSVAQYLRQNTIWWIEQTGADALRIDTFPFVNREFWHDFTEELHSLYPRLTEVGEVSNGDPQITSAFAGGVTRSGVDTGLYTPFDFPLYQATRDVFANGQSMLRLSQVLSADVLYPHPERLVSFLGNHDESRFAQFVADPGLRGAAYAFLLTSRGTPQIYSGDEIAMQGGDDPDNRRDFPTAAFDRSSRTPEQAGLFDWIAQLATLRGGYPALACGAQQVLQVSDDTLIYARYGMSGCEGESSAQQRVVTPVIVALHRGAETDVQVDLNNTAVSVCAARTLLPASAPTPFVSAGKLNLHLFAGAVIYACQ